VENLHGGKLVTVTIKLVNNCAGGSMVTAHGALRSCLAMMLLPRCQ
jgi:hypothetical protein